MQKSDKEWACSALTHAVREDTEATLSAMTKANSFSALVECLCDSDILVVNAALGLVHACTVSGNPECQIQVSKMIVDAGAITPILTLCATSGLLPTDSAEDRPVKVQLLSRLLSVMCNIASLNETALATILAPNMAPNILGFALAPLQNRDLHTPEIMIYAVQLLSILTDIEDEDTLQPTRLASSNFRNLFNNDAILLLKVTMANGNNPILLRALVINVLLNLTLEAGHENEALAMLKIVYPIITVALDSFDASVQLIQLDDLRANTDQQNRASIKLLDDSSQLWKDALDAQGLILELLANLLVLGEDDAEQVEFHEMEENDESMQLGAYMGRPQFPTISRFIVESDVASRLIPKCIFVQRVYPSSSEGEETATPTDDPEYLSLQQRAIGCLLNAVSNPEFEQTTLAGAESLWREIVDHIAAPAILRTEGDLALIHDILSNALAILSQLLRVVSQSGRHASLSVSPNDFRGFISIANSQLISDQARTTALAILGLLTGGPWPQTFAEQESPVVSEVLSLFTDAMVGDSLNLAAEAANALMDAFAEPIYNALSEATLVTAINQFISLLKSKIASERKNLSRVELDRLDETRVNLTRFLSYKRSQ
jgi:hypothetical protein